ncbi:hypothetical protein M3G47_01300 [Corynebacterium sanguinis]|uniref:phage portal protein family protein n=1 Tax=Corynebacterium sanguinis TaxID=2594913 RepID=UPI0021A8B6DF|nr:hypothetical protein [Corynebacterium sanguinis]MCT1491344.1 hypothetical protein [Corynebacterium sanguinis]MCT2246737.1 hypothetical protein [Corynebacterium sanguinis]
MVQVPVVREVGSARVAHNFALAEDNWALRFPQSTRVFAKMGREDAQVQSLLKAVMLPIRRASWWVNPNGASEDVVSHVAGDLRMRVLGDDPNSPLGSPTGRVSWDEHLGQALRCLQFGHMFFEQVYRVGVDGREHLWKLAPRWPGTISRVNVADDGGLDSVTQSVSGEVVEIPVERLVAYVYDDFGASWLGQSILRPAYKHWMIRDELLRLEQDVLDRNGMGVPIYRGTDLTNDPDGDLDRGEVLATSLRSGKTAGGSIPAGADLKLLGVSGQLVSPREAIAYHDSMILKASLAHFLNLEGKGGSYALAETQNDFFIQNLQATAEWVAGVSTQHVVEDLVRVAFPEYTGPLPSVMVDPIAAKKELSAQDWATAVRDKVVIMDGPTEEHFRRTFNIPAKQPVSDALAGKKARQEMEKEMGVSLSSAGDVAAPEETLAEYRRIVTGG